MAEEMSKNRFEIIATEGIEETPRPSQKANSPISLQKKRREEAKAKFERLWLIDPEQFNPNRNCTERERIKRTWNLMMEFFSPENKEIADLGCGSGELSERLCKHGAHVCAVDIASNALKLVEAKQCSYLITSQDYVPRTRLKDDFYDVALSTELIANLPEDEFRLYFSELSRIMKPQGYVVCSTQVDIASQDALQRFGNLAETEFKIEKWVFSYHYLYICLYDLLASPSRFVKARNDSEYRHRKLLEKRSALSRWWFKINSSPFPAIVWRGIEIVLRPVLKFFQQSQRTMRILEKISAFLWSESGISHAIFIGTRRPLIEPLTEDQQPIERKHRKQVWE